jgi:hypothetical protein
MYQRIIYRSSEASMVDTNPSFQILAPAGKCQPKLLNSNFRAYFRFFDPKRKEAVRSARSALYPIVPHYRARRHAVNSLADEIRHTVKYLADEFRIAGPTIREPASTTLR